MKGYISNFTWPFKIMINCLPILIYIYKQCIQNILLWRGENNDKLPTYTNIYIYKQYIQNILLCRGEIFQCVYIYTYI